MRTPGRLNEKFRSAQGNMLVTKADLSRAEYLITRLEEGKMEIVDRFARDAAKRPEELAKMRLRQVRDGLAPGVTAQVWLRCPAIEEE